jgi:hypothetical protein
LAAVFATTFCAATSSLMKGLAASRPCATISSLGLSRRLDEVPAVLGGLGLDHHDRDVAVLEDATGDHQVEHGLLDLRGRRERDPLVGVLAVARDEREADTGDGAGERQTGDLRRQDAALIASAS